jgi:hypothetical protein
LEHVLQVEMEKRAEERAANLSHRIEQQKLQHAIDRLREEIADMKYELAKNNIRIPALSTDMPVEEGAVQLTNANTEIVNGMLPIALDYRNDISKKYVVSHTLYMHACVCVCMCVSLCVVSKMGWLKWREADWRLDYYMLVRDPPCMNGFRDPTSPTKVPAFSLSLENALYIQRTHDTEQIKRAGEFSFSITFTDSIVLQFAVTSEADLFEWLQALASLIYTPRLRLIPSKKLSLPNQAEVRTTEHTCCLLQSPLTDWSLNVVVHCLVCLLCASGKRRAAP